MSVRSGCQVGRGGNVPLTEARRGRRASVKCMAVGVVVIKEVVVISSQGVVYDSECEKTMSRWLVSSGGWE